MSTLENDPAADGPSEPAGWNGLARAGEWVLLAAFLLTPLTTLRPGTSITFGDCLLGLVLAVAGLLVILRRRMPLVPGWIWIGTALLLVSIATVEMFPPPSLDALNETFSGTPYASSLAGAVRLLAALVLVPVAIAVIIQRWVTVGRLINAWIIGVSISCAVAVIDAFAGTGLQSSLADSPRDVSSFLALEPARYIGLSVHPTSFSVSVVMATPLVLGKMTDRGRLLRFSPVFLLLAFGVILSGSRGGLVGIALVMILTIAFDQQVRRTVFSWDPRTSLIIAVGLAACLALLFLGPPQPDSGSTSRSATGSSTEAREGADGNRVREPDLDDGLRGWAAFGNSSEVNLRRVEVSPGEPARLALRTTTEGVSNQEGHTVSAEVADPGGYSASLNVLAKRGVIYDLVLQQFDDDGDVSRSASARFTGTGHWQKPETGLKFGRGGTTAVLNLLTAKRPQATTFLSYGARFVQNSRSSPAKSDDESSRNSTSPTEGSGSLNRLNPFGASAQTSNSERAKFVERSLDFIAERPFPGYGFQWIEASHNIYLQLFLSGSLIALLGYLFVVGGYFREGIRLRNRVPENLRGVDLSLMISLAAFLAMGMFQTDLLDRYLYLPAALILAMAALLRRSESGNSSGGKDEGQP